MKKHLRRLLAAVCATAMLITAASALTVEEAIELLDTYYVDDLPAEAYEAEDLDALFAAIGDPYTYYMDAAAYAAFNSTVENTSAVVGIGTQITYTEEGIYIVQVINGGPAEKAGLVAGDVIVAVDGTSCVPANETVGELVRGEEGTDVVLTVVHADGTRGNYTLTRAQVVIENTNIEIVDGHIGYIDCNSFGSTTADLFRAGIEAHEGEVDVWWVDLRNNAGGLASTAVETIGMFAGAGAHLIYRSGEGEYLYSMTFADYITDHPVIVLTNENSASASELFAADIRDSWAGISVGGRTYGKGVAQNIFNGDNMPQLFTDDALKYTAYRFYSAATNTTDHIGVIPTLLVDGDYAEAVAALLSTQAPEDSAGWIKVRLCIWEWYIDLAQAQSEENAAIFDHLLSALAPDMELFVGTGGTQWAQTPVNVAVTLFGDEVDSRWFTDVDTSPYRDALNTLATYGILWGTGDGAFDPTGTLTRAQLAALLSQTLGVTTSSASPFSDVVDDRWYAAPITTMSILGLMEGYEDGTFRPNETLTNDQFITVMARLGTFLNASLSDVWDAFTEEDLADERLSGYADWAKEAACLMAYAEDLNADTELDILYASLSVVDPSAAILREQAGATLYNLLICTGILRY